MRLSRKDFVAGATIGASVAAIARGEVEAAAPARTPVHYHIVKPGEYDRAAMLKKLSVNARHKQVFQSVSPLLVAPGVASLYIHMQNSMNSFQFSLGQGNLAALAVLIGPSIVYALKDSMWKKYNIGKALKLAEGNIYYAATSKNDPHVSPDDPNGMYQDWSAQAVQRRGGMFMVCHNATSAVAGMFAAAGGLRPASVLADFEKNLLPGFQMVPAGVAVVQLAQDYGWKLYPII